MAFIKYGVPKKTKQINHEVCCVCGEEAEYIIKPSMQRYCEKHFNQLLEKEKERFRGILKED